jgi:acyl-coenzyme A thioesterase 9
MTTRLTATSLLSRSLLRRVPLGTRYPLGLEPSPRIPQHPSRTASSTSSGDPLCQEQPVTAMDSPIKVVSNIGGGGDRGAGGGGGAIDAGGSARKPLSLWPGMYHSPVTNALWEARSSIFERMMDASTNEVDQQQRPQTELLTKTPAQSHTTILYKFATDDILREQYRDPWNEVRIGKLLEDLDALAGTIAVKVLK